VAEPAEAVRSRLSVVKQFLDNVEAAKDGDDRQDELKRIKNLVRLARGFYIKFFETELGLRIKGFSYRDKRLVSRRLVSEERQLPEAPEDGQSASLELASVYEDLCDLLHGDIAFGYSDDDHAYREFHDEAFPTWLESLAVWLDSTNDPDLASDVRDLAARYRDVAA